MRPFQVRLDEVLSANNSSVVLYRIANLIDFYRRTILSSVLHLPLSDHASAGASSSEAPSLAAAFQELHKKAEDAFSHSLTKFAKDLDNQTIIAPADLTPPDEAVSAVKKLTEVMSVFDSSLVPQNEREKTFAEVLAALLDPVVRACTVSATSLVGAADMAVYMVNCLELCSSALAKFDFTTERLAKVRELIDAHMDTIVEEETLALFTRCGLGRKIARLNEWEEGNEPRPPLSEMDGMDGGSLSDALRGFEERVFDSSQLYLEHCAKLCSQHVRAGAKRRITDMAGATYRRLYEAVTLPANKYASPHLIVRYRPEQVDTVLQGH
eukprot:TRINITY_DN12281_c0_g1_i1.p1 TRINITY_DN12281_c0_g1~~TRINITY_DN12281_c0_g1_i1.p1  ORF type:complete len:333 (+),score=91.05 TRINITY_DN12281_c0_g1_i1:25-999(+)